MSWKPLKVLFVGDEPSSRNVDPTIPFVGTPSYKRLLRWIGELDLSVSNVEIINAGHSSKFLPDKLIYLGRKAAMKEIKHLINLKEFEGNQYAIIVDHPSPRNRKFNDPTYEKKMLKNLKRWLYEQL